MYQVFCTIILARLNWYKVLMNKQALMNYQHLVFMLEVSVTRFWSDKCGGNYGHQQLGIPAAALIFSAKSLPTKKLSAYQQAGCDNSFSEFHLAESFNFGPKIKNLMLRRNIALLLLHKLIIKF